MALNPELPASAYAVFSPAGGFELRFARFRDDATAGVRIIETKGREELDLRASAASQAELATAFWQYQSG